MPLLLKFKASSYLIRLCSLIVSNLIGNLEPTSLKYNHPAYMLQLIKCSDIFKKEIRAGSDLLLNISLSGGQSFKVDQITSAKRE